MVFSFCSTRSLFPTHAKSPKLSPSLNSKARRTRAVGEGRGRRLLVGSEAPPDAAPSAAVAFHNAATGHQRHAFATKGTPVVARPREPKPYIKTVLKKSHYVFYRLSARNSFYYFCMSIFLWDRDTHEYNAAPLARIFSQLSSLFKTAHCACPSTTA